MTNESQIRLGGDFSLTQPIKKPETSDETLAKELPNLWMVKKGQVILVPTQRGGLTRVFAEQNVILLRKPREKNPNRFHYLNRVPVLVSSAQHPGSVWQIKPGVCIETFRHQRRIPKKLFPNVISLLRGNSR